MLHSKIPFKAKFLKQYRTKSLYKRTFTTVVDTRPKEVNKLAPYLAGLIEGDGSIYTPSGDVKTVPQIEIAFDIKDFELMKKIQYILGGGYVNIRANGNSGRLIIKKQDVLLRLVLLLNGHMRTPKIEALHRLITWFNHKNNTSIPFLGTDKEPLGNSSWLSGILEADGSFYLNWKLNKKGKPISIVYYLTISQKQTYTRKLDSSVNASNLSYMQLIAEFFKTKVTIINRDKVNYVEKAYGVRTDKTESKIALFDYLNKYPLYGYKYYSQSNLGILHKLILNKEHKTIEGNKKLLEYLYLIKNQTNVQYKWDHLNKI